VSFLGKIGAGSAGTTYVAHWNGARVAVKVAGCNASSMDSWRSEVDALTRLRHPNVVQYIGCVISPPTYCLVLEFCDAGDLYRALRMPTPPGLLLRVARAVATGMAYLHKRQIMHRDLKSSNVLLDTAGGVKLTDFGVAVRVNTDGLDGREGVSSGGGGGHAAWQSHEFDRSCEALTAEMGTYRWMAPEVTRHEGYTKSADVFSYAMLLFELITHEVPFADRPPLQAAVAIGLQDLRPPLPTSTPRQLQDVVQACWRRRPTTRPKFDGLIAQLAQVSAGFTADERAWLDAPTGHPVYKALATALRASAPGGAAAAGDRGCSDAANSDGGGGDSGGGGGDGGGDGNGGAAAGAHDPKGANGGAGAGGAAAGSQADVLHQESIVFEPSLERQQSKKPEMWSVGM